MAIYKASPVNIDGSKPLTTSFSDGSTINISTRNEMPTINTIDTIKPSMARMPLLSRKSNSMVSNMVMEMPQISGKPKRSCKPIAIPIISAKSQAIMAVCANANRGMFAQRA
ncbi:hypothetical protein D3C73_1421640 [compost metagenome]